MNKPEQDQMDVLHLELGVFCFVHEDLRFQSDPEVHQTNTIFEMHNQASIHLETQDHY